MTPAGIKAKISQRINVTEATESKNQVTFLHHPVNPVGSAAYLHHYSVHPKVSPLE